MKELCSNSSCSRIGYRTPWCSLLERANGAASDILHFWYKLDWLREEIDKRTAYLGKMRRTEETKHLLDLINMTSDEDDMFVPFAKSSMADVWDALSKYAPKQDEAYWWNEGKTTIVINTDTNAEAIEFHAGDYVLLNGALYMAIADGTSEDYEGKLIPTEDYRKSIHYGILWCNCSSNINMVTPLDTAIFEALVARIIYKWLLYAFPDEAPRFLRDYEEHLAKVRDRAGKLWGPKIIDRVPRVF